MTKSRRKTPPTKRAELLTRALGFINAGKYRDLGDYLFFGDWEEYEYGLGLDLDETGQECRQLIHEIASRLRVEDGRRVSSERTSLGPRSQARYTGIFKEIFARYSSQARDQFLRAWERAKELEGECSGRVDEPGSSLGGEAARTEDALDAYHAEELLRRLPGIVSRVERLDKVDAEGVTDQALQAGFREAHHCYLYGFRAACCVLCRAILEEGLRKTLDRRGDLEAKARGADRSYMLGLLQLAVERGMLTRESEVWGRDVKKAGDFATHNRAAFDRNFPPERVEEVLLMTREIVNNLYRGRRALADGHG